MMSSLMAEGSLQAPNPDVNISYTGQQLNVSTVPMFAVSQGTIPQFTNPSLFHKTFLKGKPKPLGTVLVVTAVLQVALGVAGIYYTFALSIIFGIPFWAPVFYIITGSITIGTQAAPNKCMVKASLGLNIITAVFSFIGFILTCVDLFYIDNYSYFMFSTGAAGTFVLVVLLITNLLLFSVSVSVSVSGCRALCLPPSYAPQVFVILNEAVGTVPPPPPYNFEEDVKAP